MPENIKNIKNMPNRHNYMKTRPFQSDYSRESARGKGCKTIFQNREKAIKHNSKDDYHKYYQNFRAFEHVITSFQEKFSSFQVYSNDLIQN